MVQHYQPFNNTTNELQCAGHLFCFSILSQRANIANGEIVRFQLMEDSFAVSQATRG